MKNRHIKTFVEKFGIRSVMPEVNCVLAKNNDIIVNSTISREEQLFNSLPYIGYLYCPISSEYDLWYDTNESGMIQLKVLAVNEFDCIVASIDSHHNDVAIISRCHTKYLIEGNVVTLNLSNNQLHSIFNVKERELIPNFILDFLKNNSVGIALKLDIDLHGISAYKNWSYYDPLVRNLDHERVYWVDFDSMQDIYWALENHILIRRKE